MCSKFSRGRERHTSVGHLGVSVGKQFLTSNKTNPGVLRVGFRNSNMYLYEVVLAILRSITSDTTPIHVSCFRSVATAKHRLGHPLLHERVETPVRVSDQQVI